MRICDRCRGETLALTLVNEKEGIHYDLCHACQEAFFKFMKLYSGESEEESKKRGPGRPKKNESE